MFSIRQQKYTFEKAKAIAKSKSEDKNLATWETDFWLFLVNWFDDTATITTYTSGSTGLPKPISILKNDMLLSAEMTCSFFNLNAAKTAVLCLPMSSIGAKMMVVRSLLKAMHLVVLEPSSNPLKNLAFTIDFVAMVPFQVAKTIQENPAIWQKIDIVIIGGGNIAQDLENDITRLGINAYSTFGMTETISHVALKKIGKDNFYTALPGVIFSQNKHDKTLCIETLFENAKKIQTNDIVELLDDKHFIWKGRSDFAIETGGVKILPEVIENKLFTHIKERFFIASLPDTLLNNKVILVIESVEKKYTIEMLKPILLPYECPKAIFYVSKFAETHTGKLNKIETLKFI